MSGDQQVEEQAAQDQIAASEGQSMVNVNPVKAEVLLGNNLSHGTNSLGGVGGGISVEDFNAASAS